MKYITPLDEVPTYAPAGHSRTVNRRLLGPGPSGSDRFEVVHGRIEYGGQADPHVHEHCEQALFVLGGSADVEIDGVSAVVVPNDFIYIPEGAVHRVTPRGEESLRLLIIYAPPLARATGV